MNIRFEYLYRDAGNFKSWGEVIFRNDAGEAPEELEKRIRRGLIDGEFFVAEDARLPTLYFPEFDPELDHDWHQFWSLSETEDAVTDSEGRDIRGLCGMFHALLFRARR